MVSFLFTWMHCIIRVELESRYYNLMNQSSLTPHGPGFRFADRFEKSSTDCGIGWKTFDGTEPFFADHFPDNPLLPAVLLVECAAQAAGILIMHGSKEQHEPMFLASIDQFRVVAAVYPGDTLRSSVAIIKSFGHLVQVEAECHVGEKVVARGRLMLSRQLSSASS
jgi:3-hydroxymyristoyl/3-hydroxydecanoyl-(acyl carrier protein) dehydratase